MAYSEKVLDHYENPRNVGSMDKHDPNVGTAGAQPILQANPATRPSLFSPARSWSGPFGARAASPEFARPCYVFAVGRPVANR